MAIILDGKALSAKIRAELKEKLPEIINKKGRAPSLAVVLVGDDPASAIYVRNKKNDCAEIGITSLEYGLGADTEEEELLSLIDTLNADKGVDGILVQLPLPKHLDEKTVINRISPDKDVDAFHPVNGGLLLKGENKFLPCTPAGVMRLLDEYNIEIEGKRCVVIGRSNIVGKPMALLLLQRNGTVTVCHSKTKDLASFTREADIIVAAVGRAKLLKGDMIKEGAVIVDVGMNRSDGKLCGDVDFEECEKKASYITPVPGGVGPMTRAILMENAVAASLQ